MALKNLSPIKTIAIIDCATDEPSIACYNRLLKKGIPCSFHSASEFGASTLTNLDDFFGAIILGSMSHVHEDLPWHNELAGWAISALKKNFPILGICFGHQLMCHHLGAKVVINKEQNPEQKGSRVTSFKRDFNNIKESDTKEFIISHSYRVDDLPEDFIEIASSGIFKNDIVQHKSLPFVGIQPHPEASDHFIKTDFITNPLPLENAKKSKADGLEFIKNWLDLYCKDAFKNSK
ncbi:MAG: hypothetical protein CME61_04365 [Halobacteriovoraceae bacterium]|nr:hypothetical protein [Halobacteriovoraceae bacterium]